ncbi:error-prone DNA polymerase [Thiohalobacter sp.]|uniref:error-prone DNA polymerase n=1 Tax=Thiohalobacter sp. TaxID=2025948 RepID=UPI00261CE0CC|nr:error-prone DNA polymerase [Thiohalobacter sp.]
MLPDYAELHCLSNFTFLRGASHPEELVAQAHALGYRALAITDECSLAGAVRAHLAARDCGLPLILGSELQLEDGPRLVLLAPDRAAWGDLSELITRGRRRAEKGGYRLRRADVEGLGGRCLALWLPTGLPPLRGTPPDADTLAGEGRWLAELFGERAWLGVPQLLDGWDRVRVQRAQALSAATGLRCVAEGDVRMHVRERRMLADTLTAIRIRRPLPQAGLALMGNGERHLRRRALLARLYPPAWLAETLAVAERCRFSLDALRYEYPDEIVPPGETPTSQLRRLTEAGARRRWPQGMPPRIAARIGQELALIAELRYEPYFLTVHDIVRFARERGILCQGRGSAANSVVCFCLGITEVDPDRIDTLFERFISRERDEPPDIDVDFEHERREEVIQYLYRKYGRDRAALAATVISYRPRSAIRDVGRALGLAPDQVERLAGSHHRWGRSAEAVTADGRRGWAVADDTLRELGFDPASPRIRRLRALVAELVGFPRHLSQHVGGFVIARGRLSRLVPVENARMGAEGVRGDGEQALDVPRTVIQWDKDDLDALGLLKVDVLALGMLSAIRRCFDLIEDHSGRRLDMAGIPAEDPAVYRMIQQADTVGVFQIESRAQMAMLPRLKPACFYDLVIEVALVRPGPIQGDMVHPYLRRRQGLEPVEYPSEAVRGVLERTLGVPIFQEQVIKLAMVAAGFSGGEADRLRRAMAAWRRKGGLEPFERRLIEGMRARGYSEDFARRIYRQLLGFGEYGFPESHAASFALLVYVSAWLKCHHPAAFAAALLNSQPVGFYAPAQLVQDARRHGVEVRPVEVHRSDWDCTLEPAGEDALPALRLGLRLVKGLGEDAAGRLLAARRAGDFADVQDLAERSGLDRGALGALAAAGALRALSGHRHRARWDCAGVEAPLPALAGARIPEAMPLLRAPGEGEDIAADYASTGLTLGRHPLAVLRERLLAMNLFDAEGLRGLPNGGFAQTAGLVICRQCPGANSDVVFVTLEDESGTTQVVIWPQCAERHHRELLGARLLGVYGQIQREGEVLHLIARRLYDYSPLLGELVVRSRDFR